MHQSVGWFYVSFVFPFVSYLRSNEGRRTFGLIKFNSSLSLIKTLLTTNRCIVFRTHDRSTVSRRHFLSLVLYLLSWDGAYYTTQYFTIAIFRVLLCTVVFRVNFFKYLARYRCLWVTIRPIRYVRIYFCFSYFARTFYWIYLARRNLDSGSECIFRRVVTI